MINRIYNCISIHNGGGLIYLSLMHEELDKKGNLLLLDYRVNKKIRRFKNAKVNYFKKGILRNFLVFLVRYKFYTQCKKFYHKYHNHNKFEEYFLSGLPPLFRFNSAYSRYFILFQNSNIFNNLYLSNIFKKFNFKFILYHLIHKILINIFLRNSDILIVQTGSMQKLIALNKPANKVIIKNKYFKNIDKKNYLKNVLINNYLQESIVISNLKILSKCNLLFFYPALYLPHKNHDILFASFIRVANIIDKNIKLIVTIPKSNIPNKFGSKNIIPINILPFYQINEIYKFVDYLIFPSVSESLGLPLLEAKLNKIPIIASDLEFVYDICNPISTFNPFSEDSIFDELFNVISNDEKMK